MSVALGAEYPGSTSRAAYSVPRCVEFFHEESGWIAVYANPARLLMEEFDAPGNRIRRPACGTRIFRAQGYGHPARESWRRDRRSDRRGQNVQCLSGASSAENSFQWIRMGSAPAPD